MPTRVTTKAHIIRQMAPRCAAISGLMRSRGDPGRARADLNHVVKLIADTHGLVPRTESDHHPDALGNLWFLRAVHDFGMATAANRDDRPSHDFYGVTLLPKCKHIIQQFITDKGVDGVRMDDGGMLMGGAAQTDALRVNALWYSALDVTARALAAAPVKDSTAHHFERLAGRFRRSFSKAFWCDAHHGICAPAARAEDNHGQWPDPDQLLLTMLPSSPLPRTKQRQILTRVMEKSLGIQGVRLHHAVHGVVESPLHRVWLAQGMAVDQMEAARVLVAPLAGLGTEARKLAIYKYYRDGQPIVGHYKPDPLASAEILGALAQFR